MNDARGMIADLPYIWAECPQYGNRFRLFEFVMFDGRQDLPLAYVEASQPLGKTINEIVENVESNHGIGIGGNNNE